MPRKFDVTVYYRFSRVIAVVADDEKSAKEKECLIAQGWGGTEATAEISHQSPKQPGGQNG